MSNVMGRLVSGYSLSPAASRSTGDWARMSFDLLCNATCVNSCLLTAAECAVMHIISAETDIYDTPSNGYSTDPLMVLIIRSLI